MSWSWSERLDRAKSAEQDRRVAEAVKSATEPGFTPGTLWELLGPDGPIWATLICTINRPTEARTLVVYRRLVDQGGALVPDPARSPEIMILPLWQVAAKSEAQIVAADTAASKPSPWVTR